MFTRNKEKAISILPTCRSAYITFDKIVILNEAGRDAFLFPKLAIVLFCEPLWIFQYCQMFIQQNHQYLHNALWMLDIK